MHFLGFDLRTAYSILFKNIIQWKLTWKTEHNQKKLKTLTKFEIKENEKRNGNENEPFSKITEGCESWSETPSHLSERISTVWSAHNN